MLRAPWLNKDSKVSNLVGDLMQEDGDGGDHPQGVATQEWGSNGQAIGEVVSEVSRQVQVPSHLDVWYMLVFWVGYHEKQIYFNETESTHKGVNQRSKYMTQVQQRAELPTVTLTWHACKYKVHKLHQRYIRCLN